MTGPAIITAVIAALSWMVWQCLANAPLGYEDETGFHVGTPPDEEV